MHAVCSTGTACHPTQPAAFRAASSKAAVTCVCTEAAFTSRVPATRHGGGYGLSPSGPAPQGQLPLWNSLSQQAALRSNSLCAFCAGSQQPGQGGGYNLPPSGPPPQGNLPMGHGPSPYQGGPPPITQQGSGMTAQGGRKRALICGCNYKCASGLLETDCCKAKACCKRLYFVLGVPPVALAVRRSLWRSSQGRQS